MYIIVAGGGKVGYYLTQHLLAEEHEVLLIERNPDRVAEINEVLGAVAVSGDGAEAGTQAAAGAPRADVVVAVTGEDEDNLVICQVAREKFHVARTIARVNNPKNEIVFKTLGIDETISSTRVLMNVIEQELPSGGFMPLMSLAGSANELIEAEIAIGTPPAGKSVGSLRLPTDALVGGIIRKGKLMHADDDTKLEVGDRVMVFSPTASESEVRKALMG